MLSVTESDDEELYTFSNNEDEPVDWEYDELFYNDDQIPTSAGSELNTFSDNQITADEIGDDIVY